MIKTKNLAVLAAIVVVLLGINLVQKQRHSESTNRAATATVIAGEVTADALGRIVLGYGDQDEAVVLAAGPDGWRVRTAWNAAANRDRIDALLRNLTDLSGEYRSDSGEVLADYGLDEAGAVKIRTFDRNDQPAVALDIGRKPEGGAGSFVRRPGENTVFLSRTGLLAMLGIYGEPEAPQNRFFLDLQAVKEDRLDVDRIETRDGGATLALAKEFAVTAPAESDSAASPEPDRSIWEWKADGGGALAKSKVDAVLNSLVNIRATDLDDPAADPAAYGLADPSRTAKLVLADGREVMLAFGAERPAAEGAQAGTWLRVNDDPTVWVVTDYTVKNIFKTRDELKAE